MKQEKELKSLIIPDFAANNYVCNISLADKVEKIISVGNELTIALNDMKGKMNLLVMCKPIFVLIIACKEINIGRFFYSTYNLTYNKIN